MKTRFFLSWIGCALAAAPGAAQTNSTDLEPITVQVFKASGATCTTDPPMIQQGICVSVEVRNNGPDTYQGASAGSEMRVTVDIDEPTGGVPQIQGCTVSADFAVTITSGGTATVQLGPLVGGCTPIGTGTHNFRVTATARGNNSDPVSGNNEIDGTFTAGTEVPASAAWGLMAISLLIVAAAFVMLGRRCVSARAQ